MEMYGVIELCKRHIFPISIQYGNDVELIDDISYDARSGRYYVEFRNRQWTDEVDGRAGYRVISFYPEGVKNNGIP